MKIYVAGELRSQKKCVDSMSTGVGRHMANMQLVVARCRD